MGRISRLNESGSSAATRAIGIDSKQPSHSAQTARIWKKLRMSSQRREKARVANLQVRSAHQISQGFPRKQNNLSRIRALWGIIPAAAKRIAASNSPNALQGAFEGTVLLDGLDHVVAARRLKTALPANNWTQRPLINAYE